MEWQPVASAPKDKTKFLLYSSFHELYAICVWGYYAATLPDGSFGPAPNFYIQEEHGVSGHYDKIEDRKMYDLWCPMPPLKSPMEQAQ